MKRKLPPRDRLQAQVDDITASCPRAAESIEKLHPSTESGLPGAEAAGEDNEYTGGPHSNPQALPDDQAKTVISQVPVAPPEEFYRAMPLADLAAALEGRRLDHFTVEQMIGGGGMGAVFRGRDERLDRVVAIKVIPAARRDPETLRRFRLEAQSAARLDHPNIARVYYVGEAGEWNYIVFEFIDGVNIRDLVEMEGPLSIDDAVFYTRQVAEALQHANDRHVVHRDIKPSNVLVTANGSAKVVDMGLARSTCLEDSSNDATASGTTLGTFDYISPEQARNPRDADVRSDLYSLGCTLFYMLTGNAPFPEGTALQKLLSHGSQPPPDPRAWREDISDQLYEIMMKLMAKRQQDRYQRPIELMNDLLMLAELEDLTRSRSPGTMVVTPEVVQRSLLESNLPWLVAFAFLLGSTLWLQSVQSLSNGFALPEIQFDEVREASVNPANAGSLLDASRRVNGSQTGKNTLDARDDARGGDVRMSPATRLATEDVVPKALGDTGVQQPPLELERGSSTGISQPTLDLRPDEALPGATEEEDGQATAERELRSTGNQARRDGGARGDTSSVDASSQPGIQPLGDEFGFSGQGLATGANRQPEYLPFDAELDVLETAENRLLPSSGLLDNWSKPANRQVARDETLSPLMSRLAGRGNEDSLPGPSDGSGPAGQSVRPSESEKGDASRVASGSGVSPQAASTRRAVEAERATLVVSERLPTGLEPEFWASSLDEALRRAANDNSIQRIEIHNTCELTTLPPPITRDLILEGVGEGLARITVAPGVIAAAARRGGVWAVTDGQLICEGLAVSLERRPTRTATFVAMFSLGESASLSLLSCQLSLLQVTDSGPDSFLISLGGDQEQTASARDEQSFQDQSSPEDGVVGEQDLARGGATSIVVQDSLLKSDGGMLRIVGERTPLHQRIEISLSNVLTATGGVAVELEDRSAGATPIRYVRMYTSQSTFVCDGGFAVLKYSPNSTSVESFSSKPLGVASLPSLGLNRTSEDCIFHSRGSAVHITVVGLQEERIQDDLGLILLQGYDNAYDRQVARLCDFMEDGEVVAEYSFSEAKVAGWLRERGNEREVGWGDLSRSRRQIRDLEAEDVKLAPAMFTPGVNLVDLPNDRER